jgi:hypothetical protein
MDVAEWQSCQPPLNYNYNITTPPSDSPRTVVRPRNQCGKWGSSWAVTRLHTKIGLTEFRTRDLLRIRRAPYRRVCEGWLLLSGNLATKF